MIYIVVRKTTDWGNEATFRAQIPAGFEKVVETWNATFDMPYHLFRRELKRIAQLSLSRISGAACVAHEEVPEYGVVVPTDDDDWFSPRLAEVLEKNIDGQHAGYYWPSKFIEVPIHLPHRLGLIRRAIFPRTRPHFLCTTNNYAVVMCAQMAPFIDKHVWATNWFVAHPAAVKKIDEHLSVMNRTLASRTSLYKKPARPALVRKYRQYQRLYRRALAPELSWCEPYYAMLRDLMAQLRLRR
jgi:hypothetical protein